MKHHILDHRLRHCASHFISPNTSVLKNLAPGPMMYSHVIDKPFIDIERNTRCQGRVHNGHAVTFQWAAILEICSFA